MENGLIAYADAGGSRFQRMRIKRTRHRGCGVCLCSSWNYGDYLASKDLISICLSRPGGLGKGAHLISCYRVSMKLSVKCLLNQEICHRGLCFLIFNIEA